MAFFMSVTDASPLSKARARAIFSESGSSDLVGFLTATVVFININPTTKTTQSRRAKEMISFDLRK
jgi:hypothetical protein